MALKGQIYDAFDIPERGTVLQLCVGEFRCQIVELGRNSTVGQIVSDRSCLTGETVAPYCAVAVTWEDRRPSTAEIYRQWVSESVAPDV